VTRLASAKAIDASTGADASLPTARWRYAGLRAITHVPSFLMTSMIDLLLASGGIGEG
jgi:hypothetical protein